MFEFATVPDLLRLLVIPFFAYVAWRDVKTRRVPNRLWIPLFTLAVVLLVWETYTVVTGDLDPVFRQQYYIQVLLSVGFLIPLSYLFWRIGGFGGADAKAFMILAILFPTYPVYEIAQFGLDGTLDWLPGVETAATLPAVETAVGVFSMTILTNTVLVGLLYPVALAGKNALSGFVSAGMFIAKPVRWDETTDEYGTLLEFPDRGFTDDLSLSGLRSYFAWRRLDLDALRMYLRWRGVTLDELRETPAQFRDPDSLPEQPNPPGDGAIVTDGGQSDSADARDTDQSDSDATTDTDESDSADAGYTAESDAIEDPWGAQAFLDDIEGSAYGTTPETLRDGLDILTSEDVVWVSPGIPFLVPLFVGLLVSFTYGDVLFALLDVLGFVA